MQKSSLRLPSSTSKDFKNNLRNMWDLYHTRHQSEICKKFVNPLLFSIATSVSYVKPVSITYKNSE